MNKQKHADIPEVDIVLWGAAGFVGRLLAAWLWPKTMHGVGPSEHAAFNQFNSHKQVFLVSISHFLTPK